MITKIYVRCFLSVSILCAMLAATVSSTCAQTTAQTPADLAKSLQIIEEKAEAGRLQLGIPGMSLVIVKDGEIIFIKGFGYRDFKNKLPVTPDTQFNIGSATKAFTALTVLMSQDEGKLSLDDSPKKYLPYFKINDPEIDKNIQIRDLLSHSSGLGRIELPWMVNKLTREEIIKVVGEAKPTAKLREKFQYQNVMFTAAGEIVTQVQKMPWEKFVPERIFKPLGMTNSTMSLSEMQKTADFSYGYNYDFSTKETEKLAFRDADEIAPAGAVNSTARDMANWLKFIQNNGVVNGKRLVSEKGFEEWFKPQMKTSGENSYGFGWFLQNWRGLKVAQHGGNIDGFNSLVAMIPKKRLGFVMLTNVSQSPLGNDLMNIIWENILSDQPPTPDVVGGDRQKETGISTDHARDLLGQYISANNRTTINIKEKDGQIIFTITGQPPNELKEKGNDIYSVAPLSDAYSVKAKRDASGKVTGFVMVQPGGDTPFSRIGDIPETPKTTVEEVMAKMIDALGGAEAMKKITSREIKYDIDFENQGLKGYGVEYKKVPNLSATDTTITGLGKPIATMFDYFDGNGGGQVVSFAPAQIYHGSQLEDTKLESNFYGILNWKDGLKSSEILGVEKIGDEDVLVILLRPENASEIMYYISTKTFLPLKKTLLLSAGSSGIKQAVPETYGDYRAVDGVLLPFKTVSANSLGNVVTYLKEVKDNVAIDDTKFKPKD